jgi:hypothetical protein
MIQQTHRHQQHRLQELLRPSAAAAPVQKKTLRQLSVAEDWKHNELFAKEKQHTCKI